MTTLDKFNAAEAAEGFMIDGVPVHAMAMSASPIDPHPLGKTKLWLLTGDPDFPVDYYWAHLRDQGDMLTAHVRREEPDMPEQYNNLVAYHRLNKKWGVRYVVAE
jgi:hypothetical protein